MSSVTLPIGLHLGFSNGTSLKKVIVKLAFINNYIISNTEAKTEGGIATIAEQIGEKIVHLMIKA